MSESWFCRQNGCQMNRLGPMAEMAQDALRQARQERVTALSGALWCDLGEHAFSSRDRKRATYKIETFDEETGEPIDDQLTACGPHAAERRASLAPRASLPPGADKELYTEFLEWKAGLNRAAEPVDDHG